MWSQLQKKSFLKNHVTICSVGIAGKFAYNINNFLAEQLTGDNCWSCPQCSSYKECTRESSFKTCASILIIQLRRFTNLNGSLFKDNRVVNCYLKTHQTLTVPSHPEEDISFTNEYGLVATRKSLEAYNQLVGQVLMYITPSKKSMLMASVMPLERLNEDRHKPWVGVNSDGSVLCAHCNCKAG